MPTKVKKEKEIQYRNYIILILSILFIPNVIYAALNLGVDNIEWSGRSYHIKEGYFHEFIEKGIVYRVEISEEEYNALAIKDAYVPVLKESDILSIVPEEIKLTGINNPLSK